MSILFIHGGPGLKNYWPKVFSKQFGISDANFESDLCTGNKNLTPYLRSFQMTDGLSIDHYTSQVRAQIEAKEVNKSSQSPIVLVGHSWGGVVVAEYCRRFGTEGLKNLVLVSCPLDFQCEEESRMALAGQKMKNPGPKDIFLSPAEQESPKALTYFENIFSDFNPEALAPIAKNYLHDFDLKVILEHIDLPVSFILGESDLRVPLANQKKRLAALSMNQIEVIPDSGHFPFLLESAKNQFLKVIEDRL